MPADAGIRVFSEGEGNGGKVKACGNVWKGTDGDSGQLRRWNEEQ